MMLRMVGAALLVTGSAGFGFSLAANNARQVRMLQELIRMLKEIEWELKFHLTPLPELCQVAAGVVGGTLQKVFLELGRRLDNGGEPDVTACMNDIVSRSELPKPIRRCLKDLGSCLGRFDLEGQLEGLQSVTLRCRRELEVLSENGKERIRSYQTLAICAGAGLAILLI